MDDTQHNRASETATRKRRSSILKSQRPARTPFSELEFNVTTPTDTAKSRRVSFSRRTGVAEFVTNEATTTWKNVYEEHNKSLESSKDDSDIKSQDPPVAHLGKRIFDNQFEEVEAIDYIETITPSISNSLKNVNLIQQIASLESPSNDQVSAPQCNYELTALTVQQSKLFGNEFTVTGLGEISGRIEVNFSAIEHIDEGDDLAEIEKDFGLASNVICHGPDRHDMSEYIEVDLNMTNAVKNDVCDMSITDTIKSPKVQNVAKNRIVDNKGNDGVDWVSDKENIVINPYVAPLENVNFAINEDNDKVLVFDGKRLTLETDKSDIEYREALLPNSTELTPQRKTIKLNTVDDLPNFISSNLDVSQYDESLIKPVSKIEIVSKNTTKSCNNGNLSLAEPKNVLHSASDKRQTTMVYEADEANISMTQALPAKIITETIKTTDRRRTIIYEQDAVNISMTQALPSKILQRDDTQNDKALPKNKEKPAPKFYNNNKCNTSVTGLKDEPKTLVFDSEGNLSLTQALPYAILLNQETGDTSRSKTSNDNVNFDLSFTEAVPAGIVIDQIHETVDQRQTSVCKNYDGDISFTKVLPSNIILASSKYGKESMTEILPDNVIFKHRDLTKTLVFEDDKGNISITTGINGRFSDFDDSKNQNFKCKTITFEDNLDLSEAKFLCASLTPSQIVPLKESALPDVSESNSSNDDMHAQERIESKIQNVKSGVKQSNIDEKENKLRVKGNNLDKKESHVEESNIDENDKKGSMPVKESNIGKTDKKESMRVKEENINQKGKKSQHAKDNNIDKNYKKGSLLADENETLEIPITENVNMVETIANNIRNSLLLNSIVEDLNTKERDKDLSISENKILISQDQRLNNAQQLSVIVYQNFSKNNTAVKIPTRDDQSITEHSKDTAFDILKMKEDVNHSLGHQFSDNVINQYIPYDEMSITEDLKDNLGEKQSIEGHSLDNKFVLLKMKEEINGSPGNQLSLKEINIDSPADQLSIKENIIDSPGDRLSIKEVIIDNPKGQPSVKEDIVDSPGDQLSVKEDIFDSSGDQLSSKQINIASLNDELSIKEDIKDNSSGEQNKEVDINDSFIDEMSIKEYSKNNPRDEIIIKEFINNSPGDNRSIEVISTDNPSGYKLDTAYETSEAVASDQTIFRCMDNMSKSGSTICISQCVKNSVPNPTSSDLKAASSSKMKTLEHVLDVLLAVTSSTVENTELNKETETEKDVLDLDIIDVPSHDTSYFIIDEGTDTQADKVNSEEAIRIESGRDNINNIITNQFANEFNQCDQEIQTDKHGAPLIETIKVIGRNIENEKVESNLHKTLKTANNTQELLNMISDFTDIARSESLIENGVQCSQVVFSGTVPIADQTEVLSRKRLSFAPTRQSIVFNREDLLSNISMAQAALQKSHSELDDSITENLSPDDSDIKKNSCIDIEVVKTLNFDDESFSYASLKSDNTKSTPLKKINFRDDDLQNYTNKSNVIPTYLKDVSDNIKHLMADLVKPMADSLPFDNAVDSSRFSKRIVSTTSIQLQTDLIVSSQIDLNKNDSLMEETNHDYLTKLCYSERGNDSPPCMVEKGGDPVIIFDPHFPLNNILLRPFDSIQAHRYSPPKPIRDLENKSEDTLCKTQSVKSPNENKVNTKPTVGSLSSFQHDDINNDNLGCTQTILCTSLLTKSPDRNKSINNQVKDVKHTETNTDIAMKTKNLNATKAHVKESEVNTNIVMKSNVDLLEASSSLTIVVTENTKTHTTSSSNELNEIEGTKLQWKEDIVIDQNSVSTCSGKKRHYIPGTPRKSSIKKTIDSPSPCVKMQKLSDCLTDTRDSNLKPEKDIDATNDQRLEGENITGNAKIGSGITVQQFRAEYNMDSPKKLVLSKTIDSVSHPNSIRSEVSDSSTGLIPSSILPSSSYVMQLENVSSFTSSKNLHTMSFPSHTTSTAPKSQTQSIIGSKPDWQSGLQSSVDVNDCDSGVNIVAKIDMLPFMGSFECEWESSAVDTWCFRLLHGRIRLTVRLAHRHCNLMRTLVRADTPVTDMVVETVQHEKKNSVAILCVRFASETMRFIVSRAGSRPCFASDVPQLLRRCAAVARVAVRWGRAMHDAKLHLAYTLDNEGHLALKVANIPLRSVWEVNMEVELVVGGAGEVPWPRASSVRVLRVLSDVPVAERDVSLAMQATPRDWGHVPRTLWRMFRFLKQKTRDDDILLVPTNDVKLHRGILKEHCQA